MPPCPALARRACIVRSPGTVRPFGMCASARGRASASARNSVRPNSRPSTRRRSPECRAQGSRAARPPARWHGWSPAIAKPRYGRACPRPRAVSARTSLHMSSQAPASSHSPKSRRDAIVAGRERRARTPDQARHFLDAMRGLFRWALAAKLVKDRSDRRRREPSPQEGRGLHPVDRRTRRGVRAPLADRDARAGMARRSALHRLAPRRCCAVRPPACQGWRRDDQNRKERVHHRRHSADSAGARANFGGGAVWRAHLHRGERGQPLTKESFGNVFRDACRAAACRAPRTACARSPRRGRRITAQPSRSSRRSSDGPAAPWQRITPGPLIASGSLWKRCTSSRTMIEHLFPHLRARCGRKAEKRK